MKSIIKSKGFTLIELMVVIGIIGILATVVLTSVSSARTKGKDAAIKKAAVEMRSLLALQFGETGSYTGLITGNWVDGNPAGAQKCTDYFSGNYAANMQKICDSIVSNQISVPSNILTILHSSITSSTSSYSIMVWLPGVGRYLCMGSNGQSSIGGPYWNGEGCYSDDDL